MSRVIVETETKSCCNWSTHVIFVAGGDLRQKEGLLCSARHVAP